MVTAYLFFLRLNTRTFHTLLRFLLAELKEYAEEDIDASKTSKNDLANRITVVTRRILPGLRLYSSWFTKNWDTLAAELDDLILRAQIQDLWRCYAEALTTLVKVFPADLLPSVKYLLEEDVETVSFAPLISELTRWIWFSEGKLKPKFSDPRVDRSHPNDEMLVRIRDLIVNGLELAHRKEEVSI